MFIPTSFYSLRRDEFVPILLSHTREHADQTADHPIGGNLYFEISCAKMNDDYFNVSSGVLINNATVMTSRNGEVGRGRLVNPPAALRASQPVSSDLKTLHVADASLEGTGSQAIVAVCLSSSDTSGLTSSLIDAHEPQSGTRSPAFINMMKLIAIRRAGFKPKVSKTPHRLIEAPITKRWKRLILEQKVIIALSMLRETEVCADGSLNVDRVLLVKAMKNGRGPVDYFRRRISFHLEEAFGRPIEFFLVGELDPGRRFHLHGIFGLLPSEFDLAKKALRKACGAWDVKARNKQFKLRDMPDDGWVRYILKQQQTSNEQASAISRSLTQRAQRQHDRQVLQDRTSKFKVQCSDVDQPQKQGAIGPSASLPPCSNPDVLPAEAPSSMRLSFPEWKSRFDAGDSSIARSHRIGSLRRTLAVARPLRSTRNVRRRLPNVQNDGWRDVHGRNYRCASRLHAVGECAAGSRGVDTS